MLADRVEPDRAIEGKTVLVVEDERVVAKDLRIALQKFGFRVPETVASGDDALLAMSELSPDLVLMDIRIRGVRDGIETADIIRRRFDVPVIFLTAHADDETLARAKLAEPVGYLLKPVNLDELRSVVEIGLYRHKMDRQLRERERWFATTLRSIGDAVVSTDAAGLITFMNPVAETLTGWRAENARGRPLVEVLQLVHEHSRAPLPNPILEALSRGQVVQIDAATLLPREGEPRHIDDCAAPVVDDEGRVLGAVLVFKDVTEARLIRQRMELADRMSSLGTMAAGVAHEINNPLAAVSTNLSLALEKLARPTAEGDRLDDDLYGMIRDAASAAQRIKRIVADLRVFSHPATVGISRTDVRRAVEWSLSMVGAHLRGRCRVITDLRLVPEVMADETRLGQVFVNLLVNAAQAMAPEDVHRNELHVTTALDGRGRVAVEVRDTGAGMSEEVMNRIFEPFFTTKSVGAGTGLGLSISHGIVRSFGGEIEVESVPGQGSTFRVLLPAAPALTEPPSASAEGAGNRASAAGVPRGKVLVIDDEEMLRRALARTLGREHTVTLAASGAAAMALIDEGQRFDLILCDLMMDGMDGLDFHETLSHRYPEQASRIIVMSGGAYTTRSIEFLRAMAGRCIAKPFDPTALRRTVGEMLSLWGLQPEPQ
jgi:two-component system cell cycle sensor histidine kinase/response regulator CckA